MALNRIHASLESRAAERPNVNNPRRSVAPPGEASITNNLGPSGAELPISIFMGDMAFSFNHNL